MKDCIHYSLIALINTAVFHLRCRTERTLWNKDSSPSEKQFECTHKDLVGLWLTLRASYLWNIIPSKIFPIRPEQIQSPPFFSWLEAPGEKFWLIRTLAWKVAVKIWTTGHWPTNSLRKVNAQIGPHEKSIPWIWLLNDLSSSYQVLILFNTHVEINVKIYECPMDVLQSNKNRNPCANGDECTLPQFNIRTFGHFPL